MKSRSVSLLIFAGFIFSGCSTTGSVSDMQAKSMQIHPGSTKDEVMSILGMPGDRSFNSKGEAWQYCSTGFSHDKYMTVWFYEGIVHGLTSYTRTDVMGICTQTFSSVDWGQAPDDLKIKLKIKYE